MNRIKELRNIKGINQQTLAEVLSVQRPAISKYENGEIPLTDDTIRILADYFGVTIDYLLGRTDDPTPLGSASDDSSDDITFDDFMFALYSETRDLTDEQKDVILKNAQLLNRLQKLEEESRDGKSDET